VYPIDLGSASLGSLDTKREGELVKLQVSNSGIPQIPIE
jgi:hypothetical protein